MDILFLCVFVVKDCILFCQMMSSKKSRKFTVLTCVLFESYIDSQDVLSFLLTLLICQSVIIALFSTISNQWRHVVRRG